MRGVRVGGVSAAASVYGKARAARAAAVLLGAVSLLVTVGGSRAIADSCPNAAYRTGPSAGLADCRAYEMVSPADLNGGGVAPNGSIQAAVTSDGNHALYRTQIAPPGATSSPTVTDLLSSRTGSGWTTTAMSPAGGTDVSSFINTPILVDAPPDFATPLFESPFSLDPNDQDGDPNTSCPYIAVGSDGCPDLYIHNSDGSWNWISQNGQAKTAAVNLGYAGESADQRHVVFQTDPPIIQDGQAAGFALYDRTHGHTFAVGVKTDGTLTSACGAMIAAPVRLGMAIGGALNTTGDSGEPSNAVSADGSRIFFQSPDPTASGDPSCSVAQGGTQPVELYVRQNDATTTEISVSQIPGQVGTPAPHGATFLGATADGTKVLFTSADALTSDTSGSASYLYEYDLTATGNPLTFLGAGIGEAGALIGFSRDLSYIYVEAGSGAIELWHDGSINPIPPGGVSPQPAPNEVTPDGHELVFIRGTDVYLYSALSNVVTCLSCLPGGRPSPATTILGYPLETITSRNISDDGSRVFFESDNRLLPQAVSGHANVYEWESGTLHLISDGAGPYDSHFVGASANGNDVFFVTEDTLVPQDTTNGDTVLYDARVDGGIATTPQTFTCSADACQGQPSAVAPPPVAASVSFVGPGDARAATGQHAARPRARVLRTVVRARGIAITVSVPAAGAITVAGSQVETARRVARKAGTYTLRVGLTPTARRRLRHMRRLKLTLVVRYATGTGTRADAALTVTVKS